MKPIIVESMQIKNLSDTFCIANGLKEGDALLPLLFIFVLEYVFKKGPRKPGETEIEWDTSASGLCC
jgi:hypothetical protein